MTNIRDVGARAWLVVALLWPVGLLNYLDRLMITTMHDPIVAPIPMSDEQFGLLTAVFLWVYASCSPAAGFLADRFSRRTMIVGSLGVWSAMTWLTAHAASFQQLLAARALMGISEACYIPAALAMIADYHPRTTRSLANGLHMSGVYAGMTLGGIGGYLDTLVDWCRAIAAAAPAVPFYFYGIPVLTGVSFSMPEFLEKIQGQIANFAGLKFTSSDLMAFQECRRTGGGKFEILWGIDEYFLAALAVGAQGGVGSSYNFAAPLYHRLLRCFAAGDLAAAREEQFRSVQLIRLLAGYGYMGAAKAVMGMLGVEVGPARLPNGNPTPEQTARLRNELEQLGFFDWLKA